MRDIATIGVDLGGTEAKVLAIASDGAILARHQARTGAQAPGARLLQQVADLIEHVLDDLRVAAPDIHVQAIGLAVPGVIDADAGRVEFTVALTDEWNGFAVVPALESRVQIPTFLVNDAQAATVGEHQFGGGRGFQHFVNVTVGTGIGGGLVLDNRLYGGSRGMSGVLGHTTVLPGGPRCDCGNRGCLEMVASGTAISRAAREAAADGRFDVALSDWSPEAIAARAQQGDEVARSLFQEAGRYIGIALGNVICVLNPQAVVVGGGVSQAGDLLLEPVRREITRRTTVFSAKRGGVEVIQSPLGGAAGAIGAAGWARQQVDQATM